MKRSRRSWENQNKDPHRGGERDVKLVNIHVMSKPDTCLSPHVDDVPVDLAPLGLEKEILFTRPLPKLNVLQE